MATAQYETRTRTVEEKVVVLTLTEDEADELRTIVGLADGTRTTVRIYQALEKIEAPTPAQAADTFEYDGVTYELGARYEDCDGDPWYFTRFGSQVVGNSYRGVEDAEHGCSTDFIMGHRPLTKVTS
ncbi:phiSA1p31-related protein [Streptomyces anulatus]|uniref:phiSA1p31-related protein n=1 Tax=Streptomyces anulatus TaxID=1892 RepID=UPI0035DE2973